MSENPNAAPFYEVGSTGLRRSGGTITEEFLGALQGTKGFKTYREMRDNDPVIGAMMYAIEMVITRLEWRVDGEDERTRVFVEECLNDMSDSWDATLQNILSMLVYGWSYHEIVYKIRGGLTDDPKTHSNHKDHRIGWRKWPVRAQETLQSWMIDERGGIQGLVQTDPSGGGTNRIPIEKSLLFRTTTNRNNPEGYSLLRNAYRPWYFKRRIEEIEAIGIERDLAGLPMAYVPPEYLLNTATPAQKAVLQSVTEIVQNVKRNEQEGIVFPAAYDENNNRVFDLTLLSASGSRQFDTGAIIQRYDTRIALTLLSDFLLLGSDRVGSFALGTAKVDLWTLAVDSIAKSVAEVINQFAVPRLLRLNSMRTDKMPYLTYGQVSSIELGDVADYINKLAAVGILIPDKTLEQHLRSLADLPDAEPTL